MGRPLRVHAVRALTTSWALSGRTGRSKVNRTTAGSAVTAEPGEGEPDTSEECAHAG
ncbi:MAG TPA: hypothetical protein VIM19_05890 [Actinomycetes bacterium]